MMFKKNFENGLIESLQPIRQFALATALFHLFDSKIYDLIFNEKVDIEEIAKSNEFDIDRLTGLFAYLSNEDVVVVEDKKAVLTDKGRSFSEYRAWYIMMIGGYGATFLEMGQKLVEGSGGASRDIVHVGAGSCGISHYDAFPLTKKLLDRIDLKPQLICDLGCGNGMYLTAFCNFFPGVRAIGIEPDERSCAVARDYIELQGRSEDIQIICDDALSFLAKSDSNIPDLYVLGFVLHEILGQEGEQEVVDFLTLIRDKNPDAHIAIIEVDNQISNQNLMQHGLSKAYYNPYYLLHYFTNQKLETSSFWDQLFVKAGYQQVASETTLASVDSTGLELGYLLKSQ